MASAAELTRRFRDHVRQELYDESHLQPSGTAIYTLADPRELRLTRYVGQTSSPKRRFLQHLCTARLWMPDELPWWVLQPKLRPLYEWLRELHRDDGRLPTMIVHTWVETTAAARLAERAHIYEALAGQLPLLNVEREVLDRQIPLI